MAVLFRNRKPQNQVYSRTTKEILIGEEGVSTTDLCLTGIITIKNHVYEALSKHFPIAKGASVIVTGVHMGRLIVKEI